MGKVNPSPPIKCSEVLACLEGDYSDWAVYDSFDDATATNPDSIAILNLKETVAILIAPTLIKKYTIATKTLGASLFNPYFIAVTPTSAITAHALRKSAYGTYIVWVDSTYENLYILKDGAVVKTLSDSDLGLSSKCIYDAFISPKGKHIAVCGKRSATGNDGWVILEGS